MQRNALYHKTGRMYNAVPYLNHNLFVTFRHPEVGSSTSRHMPGSFHDSSLMRNDQLRDQDDQRHNDDREQRALRHCFACIYVIRITDL